MWHPHSSYRSRCLGKTRPVGLVFPQRPVKHIDNPWGFCAWFSPLKFLLVRGPRLTMPPQMDQPCVLKIPLRLKRKFVACLRTSPIEVRSFKASPPTEWASHPAWLGGFRSFLQMEAGGWANFGTRGVVLCKRWSILHGYNRRRRIWLLKFDLPEVLRNQWGHPLV